ncbi:MAG: PIN domain-containing protein [Deltaproteobacteria bacterium]|nr:PIN domain-containing protein [Deltaproteobacteria bacterium]
MITAIDTSVLLDVFGADPRFGVLSGAALRHCFQQGGLLACEAVWAEVASFFPSSDSVQKAMKQLGVQFSPIELEATLTAGDSWKIYRSKGGKRTRVVADFLIGSHALHQADRLLTRDRGFYRTYFKGLKILDPAAE